VGAKERCGVFPQSERDLRDASRSPITEGSRAVDHDRQVGDVRRDLGPSALVSWVCFALT